MTKPMTVEELKVEIAKSLFVPELVKLYESMRWENLPEDVKKPYLAEATRTLKPFIQFCEENNIKQVVEGELPKTKSGFFGDVVKETMRKLKDAGYVKVKSVSEVLGDKIPPNPVGIGGDS